MSDQYAASALRGKTDAEIASLAAQVQLSPRDAIYSIVRNSFIDEAVRRAQKKGARGRDFDRAFLAAMDSLMADKGLPLLRAAGMCR